MDSNDTRGSVMVEMAVAVTLLVFLIFGIVEFGRAFFIANVLNNAAREGARKAVVTTNTATFESTVKNYITTNCLPIDQAGVTITITGTRVTGNPITVKVEQPFTNLVPNIMPQLNNITLKGQATMRYE